MIFSHYDFFADQLVDGRWALAMSGLADASIVIGIS
jgi:hypothetical protein